MFKLTDEMINDIEAKVNLILEEINNGMKDRLIDLPEGSFVTANWIIVDTASGKVAVIDPINLTDDSNYEDEDDF